MQIIQLMSWYSSQIRLVTCVPVNLVKMAARVKILLRQVRLSVASASTALPDQLVKPVRYITDFNQ
jgi:hypothetical protein